MIFQNYVLTQSDLFYRDRASKSSAWVSREWSPPLRPEFACNQTHSNDGFEDFLGTKF